MNKRSRAGTYHSFVKRYEPIQQLPHGDVCRSYQDPQILAAFDRGDFRYVWTIVDGEEGRTYLVPGFTTVNYVGRVLCAKPWPDIEETLPGYVW